MATVKLGNRPKSFTRKVSFEMLDGSIGKIEVTYKYRTKKEFGELYDAMMAKRTDLASEAAAPKQFLLANALASGSEHDAAYLAELVEGWNIDQAPTHEAFVQLCNELPAASGAIINAYRDAIVEGRLGN